MARVDDGVDGPDGGRGRPAGELVHDRRRPTPRRDRRTGAAVVERAVRLGIAGGVPVVGVLDTGGADVHDGVSALHGWGRIARALCAASGVVPTVLAVRGACVSGPALLLGLADVVVMTRDAVAYVSGPQSVAAFTGEVLDRDALGGGPVHAVETGVAALLVDDAAELEPAVAAILAYLPGNGFDDPPLAEADPCDRDCTVARATVPDSGIVPYDVRTVIADVVDEDSMLELGRDHATNIVTAFARVDGRPVGVVANAAAVAGRDARHRRISEGRTVRRLV